jgi:integrase
VTTLEGRRRGLTDSMIQKAKPVPGRRVVLRDAGAYTGLELRVTQNGVKTFSYLYRNAQGRRRRLTLGRYGEAVKELTLANARKAFRKGIGRTVEGDPQAEKMAARDAKTVADLFAACHAEVWAGKSSDKSTKRLYNKHIAPAIVGDGWRVAEMRAGNLKETHVNEILDRTRREASGGWLRGAKVNGHATRNRVLSLLSRMLRYGKGKDGYSITVNVAAGIDRLEEGERESYVKLDKLGEFWRAVGTLEDQDTREAMQLVVLSAQRSKQIRHLDWEWIEWDDEHSVIAFPRRAMKGQHQAHVLGLPPLMLAILQDRHRRMGNPSRGPVFPNPNTAAGVLTYQTLYDAHVALCRQLGLAVPDKRQPGKFILSVGLHDWRRSFNNLTKKRKGKPNEPYVSRFDRSRVLHHADPTMTVAAYEDDDGYPEETRAALKVWERIILTAAAGDKIARLPDRTAGDDEAA